VNDPGWIPLGDPAYPTLLASIYDPPRRLYLRGARPELLHGPCVAVVGARSCSSYGTQIARRLGRELARAGAIVVSGLARGVDGEAHRGALDERGLTIAVLGCGIDRDYPRAHADLAGRIAASGLIVSEYPPGTEPAPWRFPARNRIVAGLSRATVVVEARERSGALITADFALDEGREVFAVPGEITSALSSGTNRLLRHGAAPLLEVEDVLASVGVEPPVRTALELEPSVQAVLDVLSDRPSGTDELVERTGLAAETVAAALTRLELEGLATTADGVFRAATP
jgi:DNA processing protein